MFLAMSSCNITKLYSKTFEFHVFIEIETLYLTKNRLTSLPENMFQSTAFTKLRQLHLDMNQLSYVSQKQFVYLEHLETLDLNNNKFTTFKSGLFTSNPIKLLFLGKNNIEI